MVDGWPAAQVLNRILRASVGSGSPSEPYLWRRRGCPHPSYKLLAVHQHHKAQLPKLPTVVGTVTQWPYVPSFPLMGGQRLIDNSLDGSPPLNSQKTPT